MYKRFLFLAMTILFFAGGMKGQDTIDTNYYRYLYQHINWNSIPEINYPETIYDSITHEYRYTGDSVFLCPYGAGFSNLGEGWFYQLDAYIKQPIPQSNEDVYGAAILGYIDIFHRGDSMKIILCEMANNGHGFVRLDSVVVKENIMGVRRIMNTPIMYLFLPYEEFDDNGNPKPLKNCIDSIAHLQVLEIYFENPITIRDTQLFWRVETFTSQGSIFIYYALETDINFTYIEAFQEDGTPTFFERGSYWNPIMAITKPLPEWEQSKIQNILPIYVPENPNTNSIESHSCTGLCRIYPNPANGSATVTTTRPILHMSICDMAGHTVMHKTDCGTSTIIDTSTLRKGIYLLKITTDNGTAVRKLVVN